MLPSTSSSSSSLDDVPLLHQQQQHERLCIAAPSCPPSPNRKDSSPSSKLTKRVKARKHSYDKNCANAGSSGSTIRGTTTINIINNFGMGSINHFTDLGVAAAASDSKTRNKNAKLSWCLLRSCLGVVLTVWAVAMVVVLRSHVNNNPADSPSTNMRALSQKAKALMNHRRGTFGTGSVRGIKELAAQLEQRKPIVKTVNEKTEAGVALITSEVKTDATAVESESASDSQLVKQVNPSQEETEDDDGSSEDVTGSNAATETERDDNVNYDAGRASSLTATGQDVAYSLAHPTDFKLDTPHAPSCSLPLDASSVSFTLVTQLSNDRMWMIPHHCERWGDHPISVVVFSNRDAAEIKANAVKEGCSEEHLTVQTVSRTKYDPTGTEYPVNVLRNLALSAVKTSHVVYADVDFWSATNLHSMLSQPSVKERFASDPHLATVVPAFQMVRQCRAWRDCRERNIPVMPKDKESLLELIQKRMASSFDPTNTGGHGSTKYVTWKSQEEGAFVDLPCIKSNRYEPYLAIRYCSDLPPFQEGFTGYGKNKMTWAMQLRRSGYQFSQLGGAFLVHYPHLDSKSREEWNKKPDLLYSTSLNELDGETKEKIDWASFKRARVDALFLDFRRWLDSSVEDEARVPMCKDAQNDDVRLWVPPGKTSDS
ncbi:hypothetical protein HJC23_010224 [Cyclotella cryptica]|uniref:Uncharacterized protein n=1 Tax=Cyclotella cryptica TaxID=29204 RepID=A0ABD3Q0P8_9STRA|eukprot:CCRYP_009821-RA/>CCRYP_009821-RA protein AED:0.14 eAED:0.14 QI:0/-1/0/1/-1/1/1/0/654